MSPVCREGATGALLLFSFTDRSDVAFLLALFLLKLLLKTVHSVFSPTAKENYLLCHSLVVYWPASG